MAYTQITWKNFVNSQQRDLSPFGVVDGDQLFLTTNPPAGSPDVPSDWTGFAEAVGQFSHYEPTIGLKVVVPPELGQEYNYAIGFSTKDKGQISTHEDLDLSLLFRLGAGGFTKLTKVDETTISFGTQLLVDEYLNDLLNPGIWTFSTGWMVHTSDIRFDAGYFDSSNPRPFTHAPISLQPNKWYRLRYQISSTNKLSGSNFGVKISSNVTSAEVPLDLFSGDLVEREVRFFTDGPAPSYFQIQGIGSGSGQGYAEAGDYVTISYLGVEEEFDKTTVSIDLGTNSGTFEIVKNYDNQWRLLIDGIDTAIDFPEIDALSYPLKTYAFAFDNVYDGINDCGLAASLNTGGITDFAIVSTSPSFGQPMPTKPEITIKFNYGMKLSTLPPAKNTIHLYDLDDNDAELTTFSVSVISTDTIRIIFNEDLKLANSYQFSFDEEILNIWGMPLQNGVLNFLTTGELDALGDIGLNYNTNPNDVYWKAQQLYRLLDVDQIFSELAEEFNYFYKPTDYDGDTKEYTVRETPIQEIVLEPGQTYEEAIAAQYVVFDNKRAFEDLIIHQFMSEYVNVFNSIRDHVESNPDIDTSTTESLKALLVRNITNVNFFKGTNVELDFLLSIFARSIGYTLASACPDPYNLFVYRVQSDMPKSEWTSNVKQTSHPNSWRDRYLEIPEQFNLNTDVGIQTDFSWIVLKIDNILIAPAFAQIIGTKNSLDEMIEIGQIDDVVDNGDGTVNIRVSIFNTGTIDPLLIPRAAIFTRNYDISYFPETKSFDLAEVIPLSKNRAPEYGLTFVDASYLTNTPSTSPYNEVRTINESGNAAVENMLDQYKFPFNHNKYDLKTYYNVLRGELVNTPSIKTQEQHEAHFQFYIRYGLANVAWKYHWEFWDRGTKKFEKDTNVPWIRIEDHDERYTWSFQVRLRLEHGNWIGYSNWFNVNQFVHANTRRDVISNEPKFVDLLCSDLTTIGSMISREGLSSQLENKPAFDVITYGAGIDFPTEFASLDVPSNIVIDNSLPYPVLVFGENQEIENKIHGIYNIFEWIVFDVTGGGLEMFTITTESNTFPFHFSTSGGQEYEVMLRVGNEIFQGNDATLANTWSIV